LELAQREVPVPSRVRRGRSTLWIACAGALAYNSWPLAFLVNRPLAGDALASSLEARSEPFAWLFILLDCVAGLCVAVVCGRVLRSRRSSRPSRALVFALLAYGVFGMVTGVNAVVPLTCGSTSAQACASQLWPPTADDVLTGTAVLALFAATATLVAQMAGRRATAFGLHVPVGIALALLCWSALGFMVLVGIGSTTVAASCQYAFLTLTSVLTCIVPLGVMSLRPDG